ncbi:MAG: hypothetical protein LBC40_00905 [Dysgonamonadaceae bacterium]|jgi:hypothetical protein|nr:hypothetical protein [Dysgonamonadaceae bacterium]
MVRTIEEAREAKKQLERCIEELIQGYEKAYNLEVSDICIEHFKTNFPPEEPLYTSVEIKLSI